MNTSWLRSKKFWLVVVAVGLVALLGSVLPLDTWIEAINRWLETLGLWAIPAFISLYVFASVLGFPNIVLILVAGTVFGLVTGMASASAADTLGAVACFALGRTIARQRIKKWLDKNPDFARLDRAVGEQAWKILLLSRLSPLIPSNILNYGFSCTKVGFWQYFLLTWLGMLPVIAFYVYLGAFGVSLFGGDSSPQLLAWRAAGLALAVGVAIYLTRLAKSVLSEAEEPELASESMVDSKRGN
ncbi:MAG: TVP38/TMEM64 family protein [Cyanophyceae cyanobacterium]